MNRVVMIIFLAVAVSCPVFAATISDIQNQRKDIQARYDSKRKDENQSYDSKVAETKQKYQHDSNKLQEALMELQDQHLKKIDGLNANEKLDMQTIDTKRPE